jgi:hypothetical protein
MIEGQKIRNLKSQARKRKLQIPVSEPQTISKDKVQMPSQAQNPKQWQITKPKIQMKNGLVLGFKHLELICHLDFDIWI